MIAQTKQQKNKSMESSDWLTSLAQSIDLIGNEHFTDSLIKLLKVIANIDYAQAYAFYRNDRPVCLFHNFSPEKKIIYVDDYVKGPYLLDPFFKACVRKIETGLYRIRDIAPDRFYQSEYYRSYYNQTGLSDEICYTFYLDKGVAVVISLLRSGDSSRFSAREFRQLSNIAPVIVSLAKRHWEDVPNSFEDNASAEHPSDIHSQIESKVSDMFGHRLTPREIQVAAQVLEGHSSDAIGKDLGISKGTVRIHRRNMYAKLRISSMQELFTIFFDNITSNGGYG